MASPTTSDMSRVAKSVSGKARAPTPSNCVAITAAVAITEDTERSKPLTKITIDWPSTTMASGATLVSTFCRLVEERKAGRHRGGEKHENSAEGEQTVALD